MFDKIFKEVYMKEKIFPIIISVLFALLLWYFMLPPLNPTSPTFWVYLFTVAICLQTYYITHMCELSIANTQIIKIFSDIG